MANHLRHGEAAIHRSLGANYTTVEASNGAKLEYRYERLNIRPWVNTLLIRVGCGFLRAGDTLTVRFGDRRQGSPGLRLQTNCEERFELKTYIDAFATYEFTELPVSPGFALVPGPAARFKAILPSLTVAGEPFRLAIIAEDVWGNPAALGTSSLRLSASHRISAIFLAASLPCRMKDRSSSTTSSRMGQARSNSASAADTGEEVARANPMRVVASAPLRLYWGDLHGQSGETVGTNPAESYFRYARDKAFLDIVGHQGNDFQITDSFWQELNRLTAEFDAPGRFVCVPGYEWSGNTGMGGDRNVFYRREGRAIHRSSRILVEGQDGGGDCYTATELFRALEGKMLWSSPMSAGATLTFAWPTKGAWSAPSRCIPPGARSNGCCTMPSSKATALASCATATITRAGPAQPARAHQPSERSEASPATLMPELTRDALFEALRRRRHYGTTGTRLFMDCTRHIRRTGN